MRMEKKKSYRPYIFAIMFLFLGYMIAALTFKCEIWIDVGSGKVKTTYTLFPFVQSQEHNDRAFEVFFSGRSPAKEEWKLVDRKRFLFYNIRRSTEGGCLVRAENILAEALVPIHRDICDDMASSFFDALSQGGPAHAYDYATQQLKEKMAPRFKPEERNESGEEVKEGTEKKSN